ncbi:hypothetical protein IAR50_007053 [Cryptococcus sp. DSM 104548]
MSGPSKPRESGPSQMPSPPAYIHTPPRPASEMERGRPGFVITSRAEERERAQGGSSGASSETAVSLPGENRCQPKDNDAQQGPIKYEQWYPGDASHNGRPAWWNRVFCCGYGLGCLLCPCGSWTCKQERS